MFILYIPFLFIGLIKVPYFDISIFPVLQNIVDLEQEIANTFLILRIQWKKTHQTAKQKYK